jgi:hypothetical protein
MVRGVNREDDLFSDFVPVCEGVAPAVNDHAFTVSGDQKIAVGNGTSNVGVRPNEMTTGQLSPPWHKRITGIEVWRTQSLVPSPFYHETTLQIADLVRGESDNMETAEFRTRLSPFSDNTPTGYPVQLSDANILGLPILNTLEFSSGGQPPICQDVQSFRGVTFCFGKAASDLEKPTLYSIDHFTISGDYTTNTGRFRVLGKSVYDAYEFVEGDELVVTFGGASGGLFPEGAHAILSRSSATTIFIAAGLSTSDVALQMHAYIRRAYSVIWPAINDDEIVHFSRTDKFSPEGFPPRTLTLSRNGDSFRRAVQVGNYIAVFMQEGVHLLFFEGINVRKDTIASFGLGTPWPDSVVVFENRVFWANRNGIQMMIVANDVNDEGFRARVQTLLGKEVESWFQDALDNGDAIDAGVDPKNFSLRFRRQDANGSSQVLVVSLRFQSMKRPLTTLVEGDHGVGYVASDQSEAGVSGDRRLYSIGGQGSIFEVPGSDVDPYESSVQGLVRSGTITRGEHSIILVSSTTLALRLNNRATSGPNFSLLYTGESIIFGSSNPNVDGVVREVLSRSFDKIEFFKAGLEELTFGDTFRIAPRDFRVRAAPVVGSSPNTVKTVKEATLRAYKPPSGASSPDLTLRTYQNHSDIVSGTGTVPVFDDGDSGKVSEDRVSSIDGQGAAVAVEVESLDPTHDFRLASLTTKLLEEISQVEDEDE